MTDHWIDVTIRTRTVGATLALAFKLISAALKVVLFQKLHLVIDGVPHKKEVLGDGE